MRVAIITESFAPDLNGVAHSVVRTAEHLCARGHTPIVVAPRRPTAARSKIPAGQLRGGADLLARAVGSAASAGDAWSDRGWGYPVVRVASVPMPGYPTFRIGLPSTKVSRVLSWFTPDIVHLASPFVLGAYGVAAASWQDLPCVAVYQTDVPRYAAGYGLGFARTAAWRWVRGIHNLADRTLAPSTTAATDLVRHGVERVHLWRRGVDTTRFHPQHRDPAVRARLVRRDRHVLVGYVGRLALEKHLELLEPVARLAGVTLVVVGDGPERERLERLLPSAIFLGELSGDELATVYACLDVFVHPGPYETFCQTIQEALASGVPVIAPDCGGPRDLVTSGETGHLVRPDDEDGFAAAVTSLVADEGHRTSLAAATRPSVAGRSWTAIGDQLVDHYHSVLASRAADRVGIA